MDTGKHAVKFVRVRFITSWWDGINDRHDIWCVALCGASSGSEPSLFVSNYFFGLGFKPIQDNFQHDSARVTDETAGSVVLAEL